MTEQRAMLADSSDRLFGELMLSSIPAPAGSDFSTPWRRIEDLGLLNLFQSESAGGFDGSWADAEVVFALLGLHGLPMPVGETIIARKFLGEASLNSPSGIITLAICPRMTLDTNAEGSVQFSGSLAGVPWGARSQYVLVACCVDGRDHLVLLSSDRAVNIEKLQNEAFEPRDTMHFEHACVEACVEFPGARENLFAQAAFLRTSQISGAIEAILSLTLDYTSQREQFGRPLNKFQALQHQLALLAEEAAAVKCAAMAAALAADKGDAKFEIAAAKLRANQAVGEATSIAHQTHGAIGFTREHQLHRWTQRMWSWRTEFGNDRYWSNTLGKLVLAEGADKFWSNLTSRSDT
ncbi:MAG: acyl-CoA dehydrogenase family protein [Halioglobus sp.]